MSWYISTSVDSGIHSRFLTSTVAKLGGAISVQVSNEVNKIVTANIKIELVSPMAKQSKPKDAIAVYSSISAQRGEYQPSRE